MKGPLFLCHKSLPAICSLLLCIISSVVGLAADKLEPLVVVQDGEYGFIDHHGKFVIKPQFIWANDFWQGLGTVYVCGRYVSIDSSGNLFPRRTAGKGRLAVAHHGDKVGFVDAEGDFKIDPIYDDALPFSDGMAAIEVGEKWGFINTKGTQVILPKFDMAFYFEDGVAWAELDSSYVLIDKKGKIVATGYRSFEPIAAGRVPVSRADDKDGYLDRHGKVAIPFLYDNVLAFSEGLGAVEKDEKWGYLDRKGRVVIPLTFDYAGPFSGGLAPAKVGSKTGFINKSGEFVFFLQYRIAGGFFTDVSRFWTDDNKFGYVNKSGQVVWGPTGESPDHTPIFGWSDKAKSESCDGVSEAVRQKISTFKKNPE